MKTNLTLFVAVLAVALFGMGCASTEPVFVKDGLVAYYPFNGNAKDESGNENGGKSAMAKFSIDRHGVKGNALSIGETNKDATVNLGSMLSGRNTCTISMWYTSDNLNNQVLFRHGEWGKDDMGNFQVLANAWHVRWDFFWGGRTMIRCEDIPDHRENHVGVWRHIVMVIEVEVPDTYALYIDGKLNITKSSGNKRVRVMEGNTVINNNFKGEPYQFKGSIDDIRLYNRALSAEEVKALYDFEKP